MVRARTGRVHYWPRHGIMATEAGRHVVTSVLALTAGSFALAVGLAGAVALVLGGLGVVPADTPLRVLEGVVAAFLMLAITFVLLPAVGRISRFGDEVRLLELSDPGAPLLRELMEIAPGTYDHSIIAGTMAEAAASEIGANALLARVGGYYHDVGKIARPLFFVENQIGVRNPHDAAPPQQSALIITAHVRDGVEMAERERLPRSVIDIIAQHHGTSLVGFFYRKASSGGTAPDQAAYRYEATAPQSREAALVMLADGAEAAARALPDHGPVQIEDAVRRVIEAKRTDGQLAGSGLTDAELERTVSVYAKMLLGQRHSRVAGYPEPTEGE